MKKLKKIWNNILVQISMIGIMGAIYLVMRHGLPKKFRLNDVTINKWIKDIGHITQNLAKSKDDFPSILNKSKNIFDYFLSFKGKNNNFERNFRTYIEDTTEGVEIFEDLLFISIFNLIENEGTVEYSTMIDVNHMVYHYVFNYKEKEYRLYVAKSVSEGTQTNLFFSGFASPKGTTYYDLSNILFDRFNNRITISLRNDRVCVSALERIEPPLNYKFPEEIFNEMKDDIDSANIQNQQRSFVLFGSPGTGKTSYCIELSRRITGKVLKLDTSILRSVEYVSTTELKHLLEALECKFILIDDIDRIHFGEITTLLYLLEVLKTLKNRATLLCTANDLGKIDTAVLRPGRIDDIYEFLLPTKEVRKEFIAITLKDYLISDEELEKLSDAMDGWTHAYIQEFCFQYPIVKSTDKLVAKILKRKEYLVRGRSQWSSNNDEILNESLSSRPMDIED